MISVLVVDDEALLRTGIARLVEGFDDVTVVGQAADGRDAVEQARATRPDVVLMDMQMPVMDGLEALAVITRELPSTAVVVLTSFLTDEYLLPALRGGASGYLLKDTSPEDLEEGIRAAARGDMRLSPAAIRDLVGRAGGGADARRDQAAAQLAGLSPREKQVAAAVAHGLSNAEIARSLFLSESTVKTYLASASAKAGLHNRTYLAILAHEAGLDAAE